MQTPRTIRPTRRLRGFDYSDPNSIFFVTICAANGKPVFEEERLCTDVVASLNWLRENRGVSIYAYCLMPDHLHLLLRLGERRKSLGDTVGAMKSFTTNRSWKYGYVGEIWQGRFHDHILRSHQDVDSVVAYILANPVRKGIVEAWEDYPWSGMLGPTR